MVFEHLKGETFFIPKLAMRIHGIWPEDGRKFSSTIVFGIFSTLKIVFLITQLINSSGNIRLDIPTISRIFYPPSVFLLELSVRMNSDRILRLIESRVNNWWSITNLKDRQIMKSYQIFGTSYFVVVMPFYFVIPIILEVNGKERALKDYHTWVALTSILKIILEFHTCIGLYGIMMLFWNFNMHLSKEFKILKTRFQKFLRIKCKERSRALFRRLVDRHNQLLEWSDDLKTSFLVYLTVIVFGNQVYICDQAYQLAIGIYNDNVMESVARSSNIAIVLLELLILYNSGEFLTTCSEEIADVFYRCKWYNLSKESRNNFAMVILRCRMPVTLTVGGFFKLNHTNYWYTVKTVYSYISLILAITKKDQ